MKGQMGNFCNVKNPQNVVCEKIRKMFKVKLNLFNLFSVTTVANEKTNFVNLILRLGVVHLMALDDETVPLD